LCFYGTCYTKFGVTQNAIPTKWKFVLAFEQDETTELSLSIGEADTRQECEELIDYEVQYYRSQGRTVVDAEAGEVCAECEGEGRLPAGNAGRVICYACAGHFGPISPFIHLKK
jgi:hypothetical protein